MTIPSLIIMRKAPQLPQAATKAAHAKDLHELFADKGKEYRAFLKSEKVKDLYASPTSMTLV